jgi:O-antigen/teichoic acid export membrane protein
MFYASSLITRLMKVGAIKRQSLISFFLSVITTFLGIITTMYFAHKLGPDILGIYFLFISYFSIFLLVGDSGVGYAAIKRISEGNDQNQFFTAYILLKCILLAISILIIFFMAMYIPSLESDNLWILLILSLIISSFYSIISVDVYALDKIAIYQTGVFFNYLIKFIFQTLFVFLGFALGGLLWGFIFGYIGCLLFFLRYSVLKLTTVSEPHVKNLLNYSLWVSISNNAIFLITTIEVIIIGLLSTTSEVAIFSTSFQLSSAVLMFTTAICAVIYPKISLWQAQGETQKIESTLTQSFTYSLVFALPIAVGGIILGNQLLYFLYGESFQSGYYALILLFLSQLILIFLILCITVLNATNHAKKIFYIVAVSIGLIIILNYYLNSIIGTIGFSVALLITFFVIAIALHRVLIEFFRVSFYNKSIFKIVISTLLMAILLIILKFFIISINPLILTGMILLGAFVYFLTLFSLDKTVYDDIKNLFTIIVE